MFIKRFGHVPMNILLAVKQKINVVQHGFMDLIIFKLNKCNFLIKGSKKTN